MLCFCYTANWISYTYVHSFAFLFFNVFKKYLFSKFILAVLGLGCNTQELQSSLQHA